jgi:hypothetical protein
MMRGDRRAALLILCCALLAWATGCPGEAVDTELAEPTLQGPRPPDDPGSCIACHPRQVTEWVGSSHNYGEGLDGTFQALEITGNYFLTHAIGVPLLRQDLLCITCHAPTAGSWRKNQENPDDMYLDSNFSLSQGFNPKPDEIQRDVRRPEPGEDLLPPPGRAIEMMEGSQGIGDEEEQRLRRQISFQGISCDACHKVSRPLDDRMTTKLSEAGGVDEQFERCMEMTMDPLNLLPPAECRRRSRGQDPEGEPFFDIGISNFAIVVERDDDVRFGPFPTTGPGSATPAVAHEMSAGAVWTSPTGEVVDYSKLNVAVYPDGTPFEGQPEDRRPYLQSSQFCGACHDVRLFPLLGAEPVHNEPFYRLENLYTEWFISPLNLYPGERGEGEHPLDQWKDNPYRNEDGTARRLVCQDCHMSLYPYARPGTFPGEYTHPENCNEVGDCGLVAATGGARSGLRIPTRSRMTTHNMTGPDIGLGKLTPVTALEGTLGATLPSQTGRDDLEGKEIFSGEVVDEVYKLPLDVDGRRQRLLKTTVTTSLAGTPEVLDRSEANCDMEEMIDDHGVLVPNPHFGACTLPIKAWAMNVNGGHRVAAGFSQERQIWLELTVEDLGRPTENGLYEVVDCAQGRLEDLYSGAREGADGFVTRQARSRTTDDAVDVFNRFTGSSPGSLPSASDHGRICRGLSGHLMDKPHDETHEPVGDGRMDDEDIFLHRIGNTLPVVVDHQCVSDNPGGADANRNGVADACETELISWHVADVGFDYPERFCSNGSGRPCTGQELNFYPDKARIEAAKADPSFSARVARADQFHVAGLNGFGGDLTSRHLRDTPARSFLGNMTDPSILDLPVQTRDGRMIKLREQGGELRDAVTYTSDERLELLYPFPEFPGLVPRTDREGHHHLGDRFGLVYLTNIFYRLLGCAHGECEGPHELSYEWEGETHHLEAQVNWPMTYPGLPHVGTFDHDPHFHFVLGESPEEVEEYGYISLMEALAEWQRENVHDLSENRIGPEGTKYAESFTFIPFNSNHMPNNRSLQFYRPQRHYWDVRVGPEVVGPIRITVKAWYRHFPPEFLRLMARFSEGLYLRAVAEGHACPHNDPGCIPAEENWFPHGPLVVEGEMAKLYPNAASIDNLRRVLMDESVFYVGVNEAQAVGGTLREAPAAPQREEVQQILDNHCMPCHLDVLRHGNLTLGYDAYPQWDVKGGQGADVEQDWVKNVVGVTGTYGNMPLVDPGNPDGSLLYRVINASAEEFAAQKLNDGGLRTRPMPLKMERMAARDIDTIRRWIEAGAP